MSSLMPDLNLNIQYFDSFDGDKIAYFIKHPEAAPRAVVCILHGYAEYSGRYLHLAERLLSAGYAVAGIDHRGHGRSTGARGFIPSFTGPAADVDTFVKLVAVDCAGLPMFAFAHSMGGAIAVQYVLDYQTPWQGMILSGAGIKSNYAVNPVLRVISVLGSALLPKGALVPLAEGVTTSDLEMVADSKADPLAYHGRVPLRTGHILLNAWPHFEPRLPEITLPLLLLHGADDALVDPAASRALNQQAASTDKTLKIYEGMMHEVINEVERETVLGDILKWLAART